MLLGGYAGGSRLQSYDWSIVPLTEGNHNKEDLVGDSAVELG